LARQLRLGNAVACDRRHLIHPAQYPVARQGSGYWESSFLGQKLLILELFQRLGTDMGKGGQGQAGFLGRRLAGSGISPGQELWEPWPPARAPLQPPFDLLAGVADAAEPAQPSLPLVGHFQQVERQVSQVTDDGVLLLVA
jgi:hypothetical protein